VLGAAVDRVRGPVGVLRVQIDRVARDEVDGATESAATPVVRAEGLVPRFPANRVTHAHVRHEQPGYSAEALGVDESCVFGGQLPNRERVNVQVDDHGRLQEGPLRAARDSSQLSR